MSPMQNVLDAIDNSDASLLSLGSPTIGMADDPRPMLELLLTKSAHRWQPYQICY